MKILFLVGLLVSLLASADNYRVPLPHLQVEGYVLVYERFDIRTGKVESADRVAGLPIYKTINECSKRQMGRFERPDKNGLIKVYSCLTVYKWPAGTGVL